LEEGENGYKRISSQTIERTVSQLFDVYKNMANPELLYMKSGQPGIF